jgi:hypothetical protein
MTFSVYGKTFDDSLQNLDKVLQRYKEKHLVLNWEKYNFMVREIIVLGHLVSERWIMVDRAKIKVIEQLSPPLNIRGIRSFLGHAEFYLHFIKDFLHIARQLTVLLAKDVPFEFDDACLNLLTFLRKHSLLHQLFNPLIGRYLLKLYVMLVIMLWGQF